jgi:sRNA-binding carbon storage regulator CsrA
MSAKIRSSIGGLVVTRRPGQKISVNHGEIIIEVVQIQGGSVRIAFLAHKEISIKRMDGESPQEEPTGL